MALENMRLTDMIDIPALQDIQSKFAGISKASVVIVDPDGNRITEASNWNGFCAVFGGDGAGHSACAANIGTLIERNRRTGRPAMEPCPRVGLMTAAVPIVLDGIYLGSWIIGQMRMAELTEEMVHNASADLARPPEEIRRMLYELPVCAGEELDHIISFLDTMNQLLLRLSHSNATASRALRELQAVNTLQETHWNMLRKFVDSSDVALYICDFDTGEILMANQYYCNQAGLPMQAVVGAKCWEINGLSEEKHHLSCPKRRLLDPEGNPTGPYTYSYYNEKFGTWLSCTHQAIAWENEQMAHMVTQMDISREHEIQELLTEAAFYDRYTKLPNAEKLVQDLDLLKYQEGAQRTLVCLHISNMHNINNIYGRENGHELLRAISRWLLAKDYPGATVYRTEGYGFCLTLDHGNVDKAKEIAQDINRRFQEAWRLGVDGHTIYYFCTVNLSVICLRDNIWDIDILNLIDRTFLGAKERQDILIYDETMDRRTNERIAFEMCLKYCVGAGMKGFDVHYQPIVDIHTGMWTGLEALCRWNCPERGPVSPGEFIPEAERLGLIGALGDWVLETAVRQCKQHQLDEVEGFFLSVNISAMQMMDEYFAERVLEILDTWCFPGEKLSLEITETVELSFGSYADTVIEHLQYYGVRIALDDFGTGYSSFSYLRGLPVNFVKTEHNFVKAIGQDTCLQYYYYVLSEIAHADCMMMIAEGVETKEQLEIFRNNGADYIQGYYFSKPMSAGQLEACMERFSEPDPAIFPEKNWSINLGQWLDGQNSYIITPSLMKLLNGCMQILLSEADLAVAFRGVLETIGSHFAVDRAFVYLLEPCEGLEDYHEYRAQGVKRQPSPFAGPEEIFRRTVLELLDDDGMLNVSDIAKLPPELYDALYPLGANAALLIPMRNGERITAVAGLYDAKYRQWSPEEIIMLYNLCIIMQSSAKREQAKSQVKRDHYVLTEILQNIGMGAFVGDIDSCEILWANDMLGAERQTGGFLEGQTCYEALHGNHRRCDFCKIDRLAARPQLGQLSFEYYDESKGKSFVVYNSLIDWDDNKKVFVEYSMDITEHLNTQRQIEYFTSTDVLTGTLNRSSLLSRLKMQAREAVHEGSLFTIAYVALGGLKEITAVFGQNSGDQLLCATVGAIRQSICRDDIIGRIDVDEFVVILPGARKTAAIQRMLGAKEALMERESALYQGAQIQFGFGVAENVELPFTEAEAAATGMLQLAEQRMRMSQLADNKVLTPTGG